MTMMGSEYRTHLRERVESAGRELLRLAATLEGAGQDVVGNGHVASAAEATGSLREAPTAPAPSSPCVMCRHDHGDHDEEGVCWSDGCQCLLYCTTAASTEAGLGASTTEKGHAERSSASAPAPSSPAPRRWWLVVGPDGAAVQTCEREEDARNHARRWNNLRVVPVIEATAYDAACRGREEAIVHAKRQYDAIADVLGRDDALHVLAAKVKRERDGARKLLAAARGWRRVTREEVARAALALDGHWITDDGMSGAVRVIRALGLEVDDA